ncbi:MAG: thiamine phosphate synthase, partial [Chloroflexota bacterium]|nr:thiamine phosphate synthase [Chloroflexota bacterium]
DKTRDKGQLLPLALELGKLCAEAGALFIVNDDIDLALAAGADGVHLGQKDLPLGVARRVLPLGAVVGRSTATLDEALRAQEEGADYIAVGAIYPTTSKASTRPAGLATLRQVKKAVTAPVVAIGGINEGNLAEVVKAGADAAAVISAVMGAEDVEGAARRLVSLMKG